MGIRRHNKRDWTDHAKEVIRPTYEKISVEIFSYKHELTRTYLPQSVNLKGSNGKKTNHRSLKCYESKDNQTAFVLEFNYNVKEAGEYRIDILYENKDGKDNVGEYDLSLTSKRLSKLYSNVSNINTYRILIIINSQLI